MEYQSVISNSAALSQSIMNELKSLNVVGSQMALRVREIFRAIEKLRKVEPHKLLKRLLKLLMIKLPNKITFMEQQFNDKVLRNHLSVTEESSTNVAEFPIFANKFQSLFFLWSFMFAGKDFANERPYVVNVAPVILIQEWA